MNLLYEGKIIWILTFFFSPWKNLFVEFLAYRTAVVIRELGLRELYKKKRGITSSLRNFLNWF